MQPGREIISYILAITLFCIALLLQRTSARPGIRQKPLCAGRQAVAFVTAIVTGCSSMSTS